MYDAPARFCEVVGFDSVSGLSLSSESDDNGVDVNAVDGGGLGATDVYGCQQLARVLLNFFVGGGGIVCMWEE